MSKPAIETAPPCTLFLFGGSGDLVKRLLMPALYNLSRDGLLDKGLRIVGVDHNPLSDADFAGRLEAFMRERDKASQGANCLDDKLWGRLAKRVGYLTGDFLSEATYQAIARRIEKNPSENAVFYLATSPGFFGEVVQRLGAAGLLDESKGFRRVVVEKPFGSDLASAEALNAC
ncbi:MAG: glucose-6-phosphate dehydrogenase, partial [Pseudomonas sp.]